MLLKYTDRCTLIPPVLHFEPRFFTSLNVSANKDRIFQEVLDRAILWRHKRAKSFDVYDFRYTDYHGFPEIEPTNWASFKVRYYSTYKEGRFKVAEYDHWTEEFPLLAILGVPVVKIDHNKISFYNDR